MYTALLPVYHAGKVRAAHDAGIQAVVAPLQKVYAARRPAKTTKKD